MLCLKVNSFNRSISLKYDIVVAYKKKYHVLKQKIINQRNSKNAYCSLYDSATTKKPRFRGGGQNKL